MLGSPALNSSQIDTIGVGAIIAVVVVGLVLSLIISAVVGRIIVLVVMIVVGAVGSGSSAPRSNHG